MAGKTIVVPATCPGDHKRTPDEVGVSGPLQLGGDLLWWTLAMEYGCDQCRQKVFSLILHEAPTEVRDYEGNAKRIRTTPPPPHASDRAIREFAERFSEKAKKPYRPNKNVERAKFIFVAAPAEGSELLESAYKLAASFSDADREEFSAWNAAYQRADEVLTSSADRTSADTARLAQLSPRVAAEALAQTVASLEAWQEAFGDVGVVFDDQGAQTYVGVKEAKKQLAVKRAPKRGKSTSLEEAKRGFVEHRDGTPLTFDLVRTFAPNDFEDFGAWLEAYKRADDLWKVAAERLEAVTDEAEPAGDAGTDPLTDVLSAAAAWLRALADAGVVRERGGTEVYVGVDEARRRLPDDPMELAQYLAGA